MAEDMGNVTATRPVKVEAGTEPTGGANRTEASSRLPATSPKIKFHLDGMETWPRWVHLSGGKGLANSK